MKIEIEIGQVAGYGKAHKAGCRDLKDPEPVGECTDKESIGRAVAAEFGWSYEEGEIFPCAPCVKLPLTAVMSS